MSKTLPIATVIQNHSKAALIKQEAGEEIAALRRNVLATFVTMPEFGAVHFFSLAELEAAAMRYEKEREWPKDSPELLAFRDRMAAYRKALGELLELKNQWRGSSGLEGWEQAEWNAASRECKAWKEILGRLRTGRDTAEIAKYLGRTGTLVAPGQMQMALRVIGRARRRKAH